MVTISAAVLAQALASMPSVPAEPPGPLAPAPQPVVTRYWYGYQTLAVDGAALSLAGLGLAEAEDVRSKQNMALLVTGFAGGLFAYALGPPILHEVHGRFGVAPIDFSIRMGSALGGILLAAGLDSLGGGDTPTGAAEDAIVVVSFLVPMIIDAAFLSSATVVQYPDRPLPVSPSWSFAPFVSTARPVGEDGRHGQAPLFGVGGTF